jgi:hypothetical protein
MANLKKQYGDTKGENVYYGMEEKGKIPMPSTERGAGKKWIQKAIKKPGALRAQLGTPKGKKIPTTKLEKAAKAKGKLGQRARLAKTLRKLAKRK